MFAGYSGLEMGVGQVFDAQPAHKRIPAWCWGNQGGETECEKGKQSHWMHGQGPINDTTVT